MSISLGCWVVHTANFKALSTLITILFLPATFFVLVDMTKKFAKKGVVEEANLSVCRSSRPKQTPIHVIDLDSNSDGGVGNPWPDVAFDGLSR